MANQIHAELEPGPARRDGPDQLGGNLQWIGKTNQA